MLPGEVLADDPFTAVQARNAALMSEVTGVPHGQPGAVPQQTQVGPPGMFADTSEIVTEGLPAHLTQPGSTFVPPPTTDPNSGVMLGEPARPGFASAKHEDGVPPDLRDAAPGDNQRCGTCKHFKAGRCDKYGDTAVRADEVCSGYESNMEEGDSTSMTSEPPEDARRLSMPTRSPYAEHQAVIYNTQGLNLAVSEDEDGLIWKVACKTGTLALSPGPGQTDLEKPLELTGDLFDDMLLSFQEKAFPYVTVPETHANGSLENTGYVRKAEAISRDDLLADQRFSDLRPETRTMIANDPEDTRYLLAGIEFTEPEVKQKALNGSIPDTSIGVKFGYRNKRTGKEYKAAWEHLALTPMPWVDGLVPFGLSQQGGIVDADQALTPYDGVYIGLDTRISTSGDFDPAAVQNALAALKPGDTWSWDYAVTVQCLSTAPDANDADDIGDDSGPETYYLLNGDYIDSPGAAKPVLYDDIEDLMPVITQRVAECEARRALQRVQYAQPVALGLADLPTAVRKKLAKKGVAMSDGSFPIRNEDDLKNAIRLAGNASDPDAAKAHIKKRAKALGLESKLPDSWNLAVPAFLKDKGDTGIGNDAGDDPGKTLKICPSCKAKNAASAKSCKRCKRSLVGIKAQNLSQDGPGASRQDLSTTSLVGELPGELHREQNREDQTNMPQTVEELLASQQAELEASQQRIAELEGRLQLSTTQLSSQGEQLHKDDVAKRVRKLQDAGYSPAICLAAQQVFQEDRSHLTGAASGDDGLNLSVQVPKEDGEKEERTLQSPSDIVDFLLSAVPTGEDAGAQAAATIRRGLGAMNLSAQEDANDEAAAKAAVDALERERHPERFNDDGTRK